MLLYYPINDFSRPDAFSDFTRFLYSQFYYR